MAEQRIVIFGATGYTGRLIADRLVAQGVRPVLAGRSASRLAEVASALGDLEVVRADVMRKNSVFDLVGSDDVLVFRAKCCNPIRGEKIVGYITRGKGVSVHSATCPNVVNLLYDPERRIEVEWDKRSSAETAAPYTVKLTMEVEDRKGVLAAVSAKIADINTNIKNMEARTGEDGARIDMTVEISDLKHLEKVIKSLRAVDGVIGVERTGRPG